MLLDQSAKGLAQPTQGAELHVADGGTVRVSQSSIFNAPNEALGFRTANEAIYVGAGGSLSISSSLLAVEFTGGIMQSIATVNASPTSESLLQLELSSVYARGAAPSPIFDLNNGKLAVIGSVLASDLPTSMIGGHRLASSTPLL